jgi:hypothetical protein
LKLLIILKWLVQHVFQDVKWFDQFDQSQLNHIQDWNELKMKHFENHQLKECSFRRVFNFFVHHIFHHVDHIHHYDLNEDHV